MAHLTTDLLKRIMISVVTTGTPAATETYDAVIPEGLDDFWNAIDAGGVEVRATAADGVTEVVYDWRGTFDKTARTGTFVLEGVTTGGVADRLLLFWLYYKAHPDATITDGSGTATASDGDGYIELSAPSTYLVGVRPPEERRTVPQAAFSKATADFMYVWLDVQSLFERAARLWQGKPFMEEPGRTTVRVLDSAGTPVVSAMTTALGLRWGTYRRRGDAHDRAVLRVPIYGGTDGAVYSIECQFETAHPAAAGAWRTIAPRVGFRVQDLLEA